MATAGGTPPHADFVLAPGDPATIGLHVAIFTLGRDLPADGKLLILTFTRPTLRQPLRVGLSASALHPNPDATPGVVVTGGWGPAVKPSDPDLRLVFASTTRPGDAGQGDGLQAADS